MRLGYLFVTGAYDRRMLSDSDRIVAGLAAMTTPAPVSRRTDAAALAEVRPDLLERLIAVAEEMAALNRLERLRELGEHWEWRRPAMPAMPNRVAVRLMSLPARRPAYAQLLGVAKVLLDEEHGPDRWWRIARRLLGL